MCINYLFLNLSQILEDMLGTWRYSVVNYENV
jgi:hypothetical protein